ncbi:MAG: hypothetical protein ACRDKZ_11785 [Actinomycetota bacterium]
MSPATPAPTEELLGLLELVGYELSSARAAGLDDTGRLRTALKRARGLIQDAEALTQSVEAERRED